MILQFSIFLINSLAPTPSKLPLSLPDEQAKFSDTLQQILSKYFTVTPILEFVCINLYLFSLGSWALN